MATGVENGGELVRLSKELAEGCGIFPDLLLLVEELDGGLVALEHLHGGLVERSDAAGGGGNDNLDLGVGLVVTYEGVVRMGELRLGCVSISRR